MRKATIGLLFILITSLSYSQFEPLNEQYMLDGLSINPAYAGRRDAMSVAISYRNQWVGFEGAPKTGIISAHAPLLNDQVGVGLLLMNNEIGIKNETGIMGNYSYKLETGYGKLSLGLGAGLSIKNKDPNDMHVLDQGDEVLIGAEKVFVMPNFSMGIYYYSDHYYAGFSMPFFMGYRFSSASGRYRMYHSFDDSNYMLTGGYLWKINENIKLMPSTLFKFNPADDKQIDLNIQVILKDKFWIGTNYRSKQGMIWTLQYQVNNQFRLAYSYGTEFSELGRYESGTHEIMLRYDFKYLVEVISPRYF